MGFASKIGSDSSRVNTPTVQQQKEDEADVQAMGNDSRGSSLSLMHQSIQAKLNMGEPGDKFEQEADHTAARVMSKPADVQAQTDATDDIQQMSDEESVVSTKGLLQAELFEQDKDTPDDMLNAKEESAVAMASNEKEKQARAKRHIPGDDFENRLNAGKGGGQRLPDDTREEMEKRFGGKDFGNVRIHKDSAAVEMNKEIKSKAFTNENHIFFNSGQYNSSTQTGKELLAHELTHTMQQGAVPGNDKLQMEAETSEEEAEPFVIDPVELEGLIESKKKEKGVVPPEEKIQPAEVEQKVEKEASEKEADAKEKPVKEEEKEKPATEKAETEKAPVEEKKEKKPKQEKSVASLVPKVGSEELLVNAREEMAAQQVEMPSIAARLEPLKEEENASPDVQMQPETREFPPEVKPLAKDYIQKIDHEIHTNAQGISKTVDKLKTRTRKKGELLKKQNEKRISQEILKTQLDFVGQRIELAAKMMELRMQIPEITARKKEEVKLEGSIFKEDLDMRFDLQYTELAEAVVAAIQGSEDLYNTNAEDAKTRNQADADKARQMGIDKAATYPDTERGQVQKDAVLPVAEDVAAEIEGNEGSILESIYTIVEPLPAQFDKQGEEAKNGIEDARLQLQTETDKHIAAVLTQMDEESAKAVTGVDQLETDMLAQLGEMEAKSIKSLTDLYSASDQQIDYGVTAAIQSLTAQEESALAANRKPGEEAIGILMAATGSDENIRKFGEETLALLKSSGATTTSTLESASKEAQAQLAKMQGEVSKGIDIVVQGIADGLAKFIETRDNAILKYKTAYEDSLSGIITNLVAGFEQVYAKADTTLKQAITDLNAGFTDTLNKSDAEIKKAVNDGLANNHEPLNDLDEDMTEAADDAAWKYDHPVLSALGSFVLFVVGLVLAILLVFAIFYLFIALAAYLVGYLAGVIGSMIIAKLIVGLLALGLLAWQVYGAYKDRTMSVEEGGAGEQGGWSTFWSSLGDVTGITQIYSGLTDESLGPFERGFNIGSGLATLATFFFGRKLFGKLPLRFRPKFTTPFKNPFKGSGGGANKGFLNKWLSGNNAGGGNKGAKVVKLNEHVGQFNTNGPSASHGYIIEGNTVLKTDFLRITEPIPTTLPVKDPVIIPLYPPPAPLPYSPGYIVAAAGSATANQLLNQPSSNPKLEQARQAQKKKKEEEGHFPYKWKTPYNYQGRNGILTYGGKISTLATKAFRPHGHHVWPKNLGGPDTGQTLMSVITAIHIGEMHNGAGYVGDIYTHLNEAFSGHPYEAFLQGNLLTNRRTSPGNQLLIEEMTDPNSPEAPDLREFVKNSLISYYERFRNLSNPTIPDSAYRTGLGEAEDNIQ